MLIIALQAACAPKIFSQGQQRLVKKS